MAQATQTPTISYQRVHPYDRWLDSLGVPVHRGYYLEDLRTVELGPWEMRDCDVAFLQLAGQEGVSGAYVLEIPPGKTLPPFRIAIDDLVYVLQGRGLTTIWTQDQPQKTLPGGDLAVEVRPDWSLRLEGPVEEVYTGTLSEEFEGA